MPVTKTTGNSRPFAVCTVMRVTCPLRAPPEGTWSESATSATLSRKSASPPPGASWANAPATECSSARFSTREASCGSSERRSWAR